MTAKNNAPKRTNATVGWHNWSAVLLKAESEGLPFRQYRQLLKFLRDSGLYTHLQGFWGREIDSHIGWKH
jgi:hypothetical protein